MNVALSADTLFPLGESYSQRVYMQATTTTTHSLHNFELIRTEPVPDLGGIATIYRHRGTGTEVLKVANQDSNKFFCIGFKTPSSDSTGVAHIVEHSVLCGSKNFPLKEPFVELLKGSHNTFLNAFTSSDMTLYPVGSTNPTDFLNLTRVYLDAVLFANMTRETFEQEAWHFEQESPDAPLTRSGVVYNEMKGAYSEPDERVLDHGKSRLMPQTPYTFDSGGDPTVIPSLTYEHFKSWYERHYHPSNAKIVVYGDGNVEAELQLVDEYLSQFTSVPTQWDRPTQPRWAAPQHSSLRIPITEGEAKEKNGRVLVQWLCDEVTLERSYLYALVQRVLLGSEGAPLKAALMASGLGDAVLGGGFITHEYDATFAVGLKGCDAGRAAEVEALIVGTLRELVDQGIPPEAKNAAMNQLEFSTRNQANDASRGLNVAYVSISEWLHDRDPIHAHLDDAAIAHLKAQLAARPTLVEDTIREMLLNNPHQLTVVGYPSDTLAAEREHAEIAELSNARSRMSEPELARVRESHAARVALQQAPDSPEALATIPRLSLSDMSRAIKRIPGEFIGKDGAIFAHDLPTHGIVYLSLSTDVSDFTTRELSYASLLSGLLFTVGTDNRDYREFAQTIAGATGGITASVTAVGRIGSADPEIRFGIEASALSHQVGDTISLVREGAVDALLSDRDRVLQVLRQRRARLEASAIDQGHRIALVRSSSQIHGVGVVNDVISGAGHLDFLKELERDFDAKWPEIASELERVRRKVLRRGGAITNLTARRDQWDTCVPLLDRWHEALSNDTRGSGAISPASLAREGLAIQSEVNFCASSFSLASVGYQPNGSMMVAEKLLRLSYLWNEVRVQGGAYGAFCSMNDVTGVFSFGSYRDPNIDATLRRFADAGRWLSGLDISQEELEKTIVSVIGDLDQPLDPRTLGSEAFGWYRTGMTDEMRQARREEALRTTVTDLRAIGEAITAAANRSGIAIVGPVEALKRATALEIRSL